LWLPIDIRQSRLKINWHRAFGLTLTDFFKDSNLLPDGLEYLANCNILTYKSMHQALEYKVSSVRVCPIIILVLSEMLKRRMAII
jgi:hypothetical protein